LSISTRPLRRKFWVAAHSVRPARRVLNKIDTIETVRALYEGLQQGAEQLVTAGARK